MGKKIEEILACHWSDSRNTGFLLAETAEFLKIEKYMHLPVLHHWVLRAVLNHAVPIFSLHKDQAFRVHLRVLHHCVLRAVLKHAVPVSAP